MLVIPVDEIKAAIWTNAHRDAKEPFVIGDHEIGRMGADKARVFRRQEFTVHAFAMNIEDEEPIAIFLGELICEIDRSSTVRVATADRIGVSISAMRCRA